MATGALTSLRTSPREPAVLHISCSSGGPMDQVFSFGWGQLDGECNFGPKPVGPPYNLHSCFPDSHIRFS
jgi:hypothetical protein